MTLPPRHNERLRELGAMLAPLADGVIVVDAAGEVVFLGEAGRCLPANEPSPPRPSARWTGHFALRYLDGRPVPPEDAPVARALRGEGVVDFVGLLARPEGDAYTSNTACPLRDRKGRIVGAYAIFRDVSERWRAELQCRIAEATLLLYQRAVDNSPDMIAIVDRDYRYRLVNATYSQRYRRPVAEIRGQTVAQLLGEDAFRSVVQPYLDRCFAGETIRYDSWFNYAVAGRRCMEVNYYPLAEGGQVEYVVASVRDITEAKRAEEALARESLINEATAGLAKALLAAATAEEISDLVLERAMGLTASGHGFVGYLDPNTGWLVTATLAHRLSDCAVENKSAIFKEFSGLWGWVLTNRQPLLTNSPAADPRASGLPAGHIPIHRFLCLPAQVGEEVVGLVAVSNSDRDYTEIDTACLQPLADIYALAIQHQRIERLREEFIALAAHELNTPLTSLAGYAQLLAQRGARDVEEQQALGTIRTQGERIARLAQAITVVSEIDSGRFQLHRERLDLRRLMEEAEAWGRRSSREHQFTLLCRSEVQVLADRRRVRFVLAHLVDNAVKYSPGGGTIELAVEKRDHEAIVSVRDHGIGIPGDKQAHLFEAFYQVAPMVRPTTGMGLGLYICREVINRHGGRVWFESEEGTGSVFFFTLPLA